ncbi:MAG: serine acetyltransferase [Clostridium sp.]|nr:serine acetyltransferase [Clostridium sp.]
MMKEDVKLDYYRMTGTQYKLSIKSIITLVFSHQIRYMYWWRKANKKLTPLRHYKLIRYARKYGIEISYSAKIGKGLYIGHPYNITVGADVVIGDNVNLHKGCTIGRENRGKRSGVPTIGSRVSIGINSTIVGNITIGDDVMIAPNSFVNFNVPSHSVVIGNPGVIHHKDDATKGYVAFHV